MIEALADVDYSQLEKIPQNDIQHYVCVTCNPGWEVMGSLLDTLCSETTIQRPFKPPVECSLCITIQKTGVCKRGHPVVCPW